MHPLEGFFGARSDVFRAALDEMAAQAKPDRTTR
jgi:hypothetical protein